MQPAKFHLPLDNDNVMGSKKGGDSPPPSPTVILVTVTWNIIMKPRRITKKFWVMSSVAKLAILIILCVLCYTLVGIIRRTDAESLVESNRLHQVGQRHGGGRMLHIIPAHDAPNRTKHFKYPQQDYSQDYGAQNGKDSNLMPTWDFKGFISRIKAKPACVSNAVLLIMITSAPDNVNQRNAIRNTWCSPSLKSSSNNANKPQLVTSTVRWQCVFLLGKSSKTSANSQVKQEIMMHQDIVLGDYMDTYRNLSLKVLLSFHWAATRCKPQFVLKTDDDCFVSINALLNFLVSLPSADSKGVYAGRLFSELDSETQVIRNPHNKWWVSKKDYAPDIYPTYASGRGYILSGDILEEVVQWSEYYKPFPNEDAYIGVLADRAGVTPVHSSRFSFYHERWRVCNYLFFLVIHQVSPELQKKLLSMSIQALDDCRDQVIQNSWN